MPGGCPRRGRTQAEVIEAIVADRVAAETAKLRAELEAKYEVSRLQAELADLKQKVRAHAARAGSNSLPPHVVWFLGWFL